MIWTTNCFPASTFSLTTDSKSEISTILPLNTFLALELMGFLDKIMSSGLTKTDIFPDFLKAASISTPSPISISEVPSLRILDAPENTFSSLAKLAKCFDGVLKIS